MGQICPRCGQYGGRIFQLSDGTSGCSLCVTLSSQCIKLAKNLLKYLQQSTKPCALQLSYRQTQHVTHYQFQKLKEQLRNQQHQIQKIKHQNQKQRQQIQRIKGQKLEKESQISYSSISSKNAQRNLQRFTCSLTLEIMKYPHDLPCGHCFEGSKIKQWFTKNKTCPLCQQQFEEKDLRRNLMFQQSIQQFQEKLKRKESKQLK